MTEVHCGIDSGRLHEILVSLKYLQIQEHTYIKSEILRIKNIHRKNMP